MFWGYCYRFACDFDLSACENMDLRVKLEVCVFLQWNVSNGLNVRIRVVSDNFWGGSFRPCRWVVSANFQVESFRPKVISARVYRN